MTTPTIKRWVEIPATHQTQIRLMNPAYPPKLLAARRAAFVAQIEAHNARVKKLHDPADCSGIETPPVSEWGDERNSRAEPY